MSIKTKGGVTRIIEAPIIGRAEVFQPIAKSKIEEMEKDPYFIMVGKIMDKLHPL